METTPAIVTYAPLIAASAIGLGIIVTMAILAGKIIFRLGGLFAEVSNLSKEVSNLSKSVEGLRTDMAAGFQQSRADTDQLRADMVAGFQQSRADTDQLRADMVAGFQQSRADTDQLRADMLAGHEKLRDEIRRGNDQTRQMVQQHRHNDTDGSVTFIVPPGSD